MKKIIRVEDLDCAHCASKLEDAISEIPGVSKVSVSFMAQKIVLEFDDNCLNDIMKQVKKVAKKVVPDCTIII